MQSTAIAGQTGEVAGVDRKTKRRRRQVNRAADALPFKLSRAGGRDSRRVHVGGLVRWLGGVGGRPRTRRGDPTGGSCQDLAARGRLAEAGAIERGGAGGVV